MKDLTQAKNTVFRLLKYRLRSEQEIRSKLKQKQFPEEIIAEATAYFLSIGIINDRTFAQKWIVARLNRPFGPNRIRQELRLKGIDEDIIKDELHSILTDFAEEEIVCQLAQKRAASYRNIEDDKIKQRVYGFLTRRGFSGDSIIKALKKINK